MWLEECSGNRGVCGKQGFHSSTVTPMTSAGAGRVRTGNLCQWRLIYIPPNRAGLEDGSVWSIPVSTTDRCQEPQSTDYHVIYAPPTKKDPAELRVYTVGLTFRLRGGQLLQQSKPVRNHLMGKINENSKFLGNNRASNIDADAKQLREKWYPSQCKQ